jgi:hypothetical protein
MSKIIYVAVKHGKPVQIARPLQGSTQIATEKTASRWRGWRQVIAWDGWKDLANGVYSLKPSWKGGYGRVGEGTTPKKINVSSKIKQIDKKWGGGYAHAGTGSPGILGYQRRAEASGVAQKNRAREAGELLAWLKGLHEDDDSAGSLFERLTGQR